MTNSTKCYECGDTGHLAYDCPNKGYIRSLAMMKRQPTEPTLDYLAARDRLGIPSGVEEGTLFSVACPWCDAGPYRQCVNPGTGQAKQQAHDARYEAAGMDPPRNGAPQRLARQQAAEARTGRLVI